MKRHETGEPVTKVVSLKQDHRRLAFASLARKVMFKIHHVDFLDFLPTCNPILSVPCIEHPRQKKFEGCHRYVPCSSSLVPVHR